MKKKLHMVLFGMTGPESWKSDSALLYDWRDPGLLRDSVRMAERAKFDMVLFADTIAVTTKYGNSMQHACELGNSVVLDPMLTLAMLSSVTERIGLGCTVSSTFTPPYLVARQLNTLDFLSRGRAAWNVVTTAQDEAAANFGVDLPPHDLRYEMADEHMAVCRALWQSWEPNAVVMDREQQIFADYTKVHHINFEGKYYKCRGPLNAPASPQREPVIVTAGTSPRGQQFAAQHAEAVFANKHTFEEMKTYVKQLRAQLVKAGRAPYSCKIFFSVRPWLGDTEQAAIEKRERHQSTVKIEHGLAEVSIGLGYDLTKFDLDQPLPADLPVNAIIGKLTQYRYGDKPPTLREIGWHEARRETFPVYGTPEHVADILEHAADEADADGYIFRLMTQDYLNFAEVCTKLIPILQKRGRARTEYTGTTLRQHLFEA